MSVEVSMVQVEIFSTEEIRARFVTAEDLLPTNRSEPPGESSVRSTLSAPVFVCGSQFRRMRWLGIGSK